MEMLQTLQAVLAGLDVLQKIPILAVLIPPRASAGDFSTLARADSRLVDAKVR